MEKIIKKEAVCPLTECRTIIPPDTIRLILGPETFMKYEEGLFKQSTMNKNHFQCPGTNCAFIVDLTDYTFDLVFCPNCQIK